MPVNNIIQGTASGVVLDVDTTSVGNVGGGEDDLIVSTIPANTLDVDHKYIHFSASGQFATSINNKQLRAYFGSTKIFDSGSLAITSVSDWILEGWIIRISATSEHALVKFESSSSVLLADAAYSTPTEDLTNQVTLKCTGAGTSDNDITQTDLIVDVNNGGTGLGDVSGPSSSIDGHFASFNGTTGKIIKDGTQPTTLVNDLLWSAKGQLAVGVGTATGTVLSPGTDGQLLSSATGTASGLQWVTNSGGGASISIGAIASLPTNGTNIGDTYKCTDSVYEFVWTGSVWQAYFRGTAVTVPPITGWSWINSGTNSSISYTYGYPFAVFGASAADYTSAVVRACPTGTFTLEIGILVQIITANSGGAQGAAGPIMSDGTKSIDYGLYGYAGQGTTPRMRTLKWTSPTQVLAIYSEWAGTEWTGYFGIPMFYKVVADATNFTWYHSTDKFNWVQFDQRTRGDFLATTPTLIGVGGYNRTGKTIAIIHWKGVS